jgi:hypothetical protein
MNANIAGNRLKCEFLFTLTGTVGEPLHIGETPLGERRIFPIVGGEFEGPRIKGRVLEGGSDAMITRGENLWMRLNTISV